MIARLRSARPSASPPQGHSIASAVKYVGAAYLFYLGIRALLGHGGELQLASSRIASPGLAYRQAVLAEVLNPKTALFFLAFLPQFVRPGQGAGAAQVAVLGLVFVAMSAAYTALLAPPPGRWRAG